MGKLLRQNSVDNVNSFYSICKNKIIFCLFLVFLNSQDIQSQNLVFANTISSESHVTDSNLAIDSDLATRARVRANSGIALGIGAYNGHIELEFPTILPANTTRSTTGSRSEIRFEINFSVGGSSSPFR